MKWLAVFLLLSSCGGLPFGMLGGGGVNTAANTQVGKENRQQVSLQENRTEAGRDIVTTTRQVEAQTVESVIINYIDEIPPWMWLLAFLGWMLPTPQHMALVTYNAFRDFLFGKRRRNG
jgi:predicted DCC family thiol-disulfide oxidoreductase YuxK